MKRAGDFLKKEKKMNNWAIFRYLCPTYYICMARFDSRAKAEDYFKRLRALLPNAKLEVVFDNDHTH